MSFHFLSWLRSWKAPVLWVVVVVGGLLAGRYSVLLYLLGFGIADFLLIAIPLAWIVRGLEKLL